MTRSHVFANRYSTEQVITSRDHHVALVLPREKLDSVTKAYGVSSRTLAILRKCQRLKSKPAKDVLVHIIINLRFVRAIAGAGADAGARAGAGAEPCSHCFRSPDYKGDNQPRYGTHVWPFTTVRLGRYLRYGTVGPDQRLLSQLKGVFPKAMSLGSAHVQIFPVARNVPLTGSMLIPYRR